MKFDVDILHNPGSEWQEMFTIILGPATPSGAVLGELSTTTVIILDNQASGSTVFPAPPIVDNPSYHHPFLQIYHSSILIFILKTYPTSK